MVKVPKLITKFPTACDSSRGAVSPVSATALHVRPALAAVGWMKIAEFTVTAELVTWQVPAEAEAEQENAPADAVTHAATDGFAAVPAAAQIASVRYFVA